MNKIYIRIKKYFKSKKNRIIIISILSFVLIIFFIFKIGGVHRLSSNWSRYSNQYYNDYSIDYPTNLIVTENGQDNRRAVIHSSNYDIDMTTGEIKSGYKIDIFATNFTNLGNLFSCNKDKSSTGEDCLLARSETQIRYYQNGEVKTKITKINGYPAIRYEFISNVGKNNNIGIVVNKNNDYYIALIAYKNDKDIKLFNRIINSFKFIKPVQRSLSLPIKESNEVFTGPLRVKPI